MAKQKLTLKEFVEGKTKGREIRQVGKQPHQNFFLEDRFEQDPRKYCPHCGNDEVRVLHTHNLDGTDYGCSNCKSTYGLYDYTRSEDM